MRPQRSQGGCSFFYIGTFWLRLWLRGLTPHFVIFFLLDISIYLFINQPGFGLGWCYFSSSGIYKLALVSVSVVWCHGGSDLTNIVQVEAEQGLRQFGTDGNAADNEDGGETGGIARVLGTGNECGQRHCQYWNRNAWNSGTSAGPTKAGKLECDD